MHLFPLKTPLFHPGEKLGPFFLQALKTNRIELQERSVIVVASKIVALAQNRVVKASKNEMETLIRAEAEKVWPTEVPGFWLTLKDGMLIANAGIDASNAAPGTLILWPENAQAAADQLHPEIQSALGLKALGILIMDSRCTPLRRGVSGLALAWSGFEGVMNEIGKKDLFGTPLEVTQNAVADNLASAAQLLIGSSAESTPFVICAEAPVEFTDRQQSPESGKIATEEDLLAPFWKKME